MYSSKLLIHQPIKLCKVQGHNSTRPQQYRITAWQLTESLAYTGTRTALCIIWCIQRHLTHMRCGLCGIVEIKPLSPWHWKPSSFILPLWFTFWQGLFLVIQHICVTFRGIGVTWCSGNLDTKGAPFGHPLVYITLDQCLVHQWWSMRRIWYEADDKTAEVNLLKSVDAQTSLGRFYPTDPYGPAWDVVQLRTSLASYTI